MKLVRSPYVGIHGGTTEAETGSAQVRRVRRALRVHGGPAARPGVLPEQPAAAARTSARDRLRRRTARALARAPLRGGRRDRSLRADARACQAGQRRAERRLSEHGRERAGALGSVRLHRQPHDLPPSGEPAAHAFGAAPPDRTGRSDRDRRRGLRAVCDSCLALRGRCAVRAAERFRSPRPDRGVPTAALPALAPLARPSGERPVPVAGVLPQAVRRRAAGRDLRERSGRSSACSGTRPRSAASQRASSPRRRPCRPDR